MCKRNYGFIKVTIILFSVLFVLGIAPVASAEIQLREVENSKVCMINNKLFAEEQIPVQVEGKTYYGCCEMCEAKLKENPQSRMAIDLVSKKEVDKATAVIGAGPDGKVYYFESEENLKSFKP